MPPFPLPTDLFNDHLTNIRCWTRHREPGRAGDRLSASPPDAGLSVFLCGINSPEHLLLTNRDRLWEDWLQPAGVGKVHWPRVGGPRLEMQLWALEKVT